MRTEIRMRNKAHRLRTIASPHAVLAANRRLQPVPSLSAACLRIRVNSQTTSADVHVPFGGVKAGGFGPHEQVRAARDFYTDLVTVYGGV
jgi:acyl-CoA reductase-like NAD-dependent aldehyde dehydrogenase